LVRVVKEAGDNALVYPLLYTFKGCFCNCFFRPSNRPCRYGFVYERVPHITPEYEYLYDKPYDDKENVHVAVPFTVESLSPHRVLGLDENDDLIDIVSSGKPGYGAKRDFTSIILENPKTAGVRPFLRVQQAAAHPRARGAHERRPAHGRRP
jgi:hypothetical protein